MNQFKPLIIVLILSTLALAALGCSNFGYKNGVASIDLSLNIGKLNSIVSGIGGNDSDFIGKIDKIELIAPNVMRITGDFRLEEGKVEPGSIDFAFTAHNGVLAVQVVQVNLSGLSLDSGIVQSFNSALGNALGNEAADQSQGKGGVTNVQVRDNKLVITVAIKVK